jgi:molybdopterin/thiamine biosynthesis adenylyltransferase
MKDIGASLRALGTVGTDSEGQECWVIPLRALSQLGQEMSLPLRDVEILSLRHRVMPARYLRNLGTVGWEGQIALLQATVGVVGAGGLGGWIVEGLARMGVGCLVIVDGDTFEENNLNRQALCTESNLGQSKVLAASERVAEINAVVDVIPHHLEVDEGQMVELFHDVDVLVDALDSLPARLALQRAAQTLKVPLVHGAIAGYVAQVMTILPEDVGLPGLYLGEQVPEHGIEEQWGNPAATPMMAAAWQIQEVVKLLTGQGQPLRNRLLFMDSEVGTIDMLEM